ncbi:MAG: hypothetical protein OEZ18_01345 [Candidatus Bathyarchaeota archaeon]|nr:hypothetical protein [Candidatus Bathyarchaeota archaeon]
MKKIFGYGEDALTLWALKHRISDILNKFKDKTTPSDCIVFYRPSFGRSGGKNSPEFGEFDAILVSLKNIYLVESKWDNLAASKSEKNIIGPVQGFRHQILSWYLTHWHRKYLKNWSKFVEYEGQNFKKTFNKPIASNGLLVENLEFTLEALLEHCKKFSGKQRIKNILLFFHKGRLSVRPIKPKDFTLVTINYGKYITGNFIALE